MTAGKNRQILLASRPRGEPVPDNFKLVETDVPEPSPGQLLLRTIYLSLDPYMRGRMDAGLSYARPVEVRVQPPSRVGAGRIPMFGR
jgi:NADPH-dependent curcumin reductase CurA